MKLRPKIVIIFVGVSVIPIAIVIGLSIWSVLNDNSSDLTARLLSVGFIMSMLVFFFAVQFAKYVTDPITSVAEAARKLSQGHLHERVQFQSKDELGELAVSFNQMANQIEHVDTVKSDFIDLASHHLRTPETIINTSTEELLSRFSEGLSEQQMSYLRLISKGSGELHDITETLLTISSVQLGNAYPHTQEVPLRAMLHEVAEQFREEARQKNIELNILDEGEEITVKIDPQLLRVALRALVRNAIFFTRNGSVNLSATQENTNIHIKITDTGIGIPAEDLPSIFSKFFQAKNGKELYPTGKGLGLYLARICTEGLGGEATVESTLGKGSTFTITLPAQPKTSVAQQPTPSVV